MTGKEETNFSADFESDLVFSQLDVKRVYQVVDCYEVDKATENPNKDSNSVLKQVLGKLTGRKNQIDETSSLLDYLYYYPNRQASIRQLRSDVFSYLNKHKLTTKVLEQSGVCVL